MSGRGGRFDSTEVYSTEARVDALEEDDVDNDGVETGLTDEGVNGVASDLNIQYIWTGDNYNNKKKIILLAMISRVLTSLEGRFSEFRCK